MGTDNSKYAYIYTVCYRSLISYTARGEVCAPKCLRPGAGDDPLIHTESRIYGRRVIDLDMLNDALADHRQSHQCHYYSPAIESVEKWGVTCSISLRCASCQSSPATKYRMFEVAVEQRRGPKRAAVNKQLGYAVQDSSLGMYAASQLFASMDIQPPAKSCCQKVAKTVNDEMKLYNERDMEILRKEKVEDNLMRGLSGQAVGEVAISIDSRYNSVSFGSRGKMGQSCTQSVTTAIDSNSKKIIATVMDNKVCLVGSRMRNKGETVVCGPNATNHRCTATIDCADNITERDMNTRLAENMLHNGLYAAVVTSDNDGSGARPYQAVYNKVGYKVLPQSDPTHLAQSQLRFVNRIKFKYSVFGVNTKSDCDARQQLLSRDIPHRTSMVLKKIEKQSYNASMQNIIQSLVSCFCGNHELCTFGLTGCNGEPDNNWMLESWLYKTCGLDSLACDDAEKKMLGEAFRLRIDPAARQATHIGYSTQANEAFNRKLSKNMPKNIIFSRNHPGRLASAVHMYNHGRLKSVTAKLKAAGSEYHYQDMVAVRR